MREIKFRLWDKEEKRVIYLDRGYPYHHTFSVKEGGNIEYYNLQNGSGGSEYDIMQYTGLKDKNGKEIYEGDILENGLGDVVDRYEVLWEGYGFAVRKRLTIKQGKKINKRAVLVNRVAIENHADIIGNIYENKELLEED